jgi:biotin synthase
VPVPGTPLENAPPLDPFEFVRTIAVARITMPGSHGAPVGRAPGDERRTVQALCFLAGANSIFYGDKLLTTGNPEADRDEALFARLGLHAA